MGPWMTNIEGGWMWLVICVAFCVLAGIVGLMRSYFNI